MPDALQGPPEVRFPQGAVDVVTAEGVALAKERLAAAREIAVDVEADQMHAFRGRLCFVQLATDEAVWLLDTLLPEVNPKELSDLFADPARTKFFHAAGGDLQFLAEAGIRVSGLFDTHRAATLLGWPKVGLADLVREQLHVELLKEHQQSDFSIRPLPPGMRDYIADDVRYLCEVGRRVREACRTADILEEVDLDCQRMADEALARPEIGSDYAMKLKGPVDPKLRPMMEAIALALHKKRLSWAEAADVPMGRMLSNAAISAIATRLPANAKELARAQGVRGPFVREHGEEVLSLVKDLVEKSRRGELKPPEKDPASKDSKRRRRTELLKVFRGQKAAERKVTASAVLPNQLVDDLAAAPPPGLAALEKVPYFGEKRARLYGEEIVKLLASA